MPCVPPPPPPPVVDDELPVGVEWPEDTFNEEEQGYVANDTETPFGIALFDYFTDHPDDLCFSVCLALYIYLHYIYVNINRNSYY
jgi:hypothetical protein